MVSLHGDPSSKYFASSLLVACNRLCVMGNSCATRLVFLIINFLLLHQCVAISKLLECTIRRLLIVVVICPVGWLYSASGCLFYDINSDREILFREGGDVYSIPRVIV